MSNISGLVIHGCLRIAFNDAELSLRQWGSHLNPLMASHYAGDIAVPQESRTSVALEYFEQFPGSLKGIVFIRCLRIY